MDNGQGDQKINSDRQTCESSIGKAAPNQNNQLFVVLYNTYQPHEGRLARIRAHPSA